MIMTGSIRVKYGSLELVDYKAKIVLDRLMWDRVIWSVSIMPKRKTKLPQTISLAELRLMVIRARALRTDSTQIERTLSAKLREYRTGAGLTLVGLAAKLRISFAHLNQLERGVKPWTDGMLERLEEVAR